MLCLFRVFVVLVVFVVFVAVLRSLLHFWSLLQSPPVSPTIYVWK